MCVRVRVCVCSCACVCVCLRTWQHGRADNEDDHEQARGDDGDVGDLAEQVLAERDGKVDEGPHQEVAQEEGPMDLHR